jgi:cell shape-determining protein MreD
MAARIAKFIVLAYLVAFSQTILANLTAIQGIVPNYGIIIILLIALRKEYDIALPAIFMCALIIDALTPELLGVGTLIRFGIGVIAFQMRRSMNIEQLFSRLYLIAGADLVYQLLYQLVANKFDISIVGRIYWEVSLPTLVYTTVVGFAAMFLLDLEYKLEITRRRVG